MPARTAPAPRTPTFSAALARRRQRATPVLPPLVGGPLIGLLALLIVFALAARQPEGSRAPIVPPTLTHGGPLQRSWPMLAIGSDRDALLDGSPVRAGTIPDRQRLHTVQSVSVLADRFIATEKLAGWLQVLRQLDVTRVQLVVQDPRGEWRAIDARLVDVQRSRLPCASRWSPWGLLVDEHRVLLELDARATLQLSPGCLALVPRW